MEVRTTGVPVIGERELRRAADILRRYKQGKQNLERRIIADEDWWKLRQWRQFSDKGNPNDDRPASGWLFNVIMGKHADAVAAVSGAGHPPAGTGRPAGGADALVNHSVHFGAERF